MLKRTTHCVEGLLRGERIDRELSVGGLKNGEDQSPTFVSSSFLFNQSEKAPPQAAKRGELHRRGNQPHRRLTTSHRCPPVSPMGGTSGIRVGRRTCAAGNGRWCRSVSAVARRKDPTSAEDTGSATFVTQSRVITSPNT